MPAALKTPLLEPDFAPDNSTLTSTRNRPTPSARAASAAAPRDEAALSGASPYASARAASPARISPREAERDLSAPAVRSRPQARTPLETEPGSRAVRRERQHRRFRPTLTAVLCIGAFLGQLILLLWLHGKTLSSAREVEKIDAQIADVSNHIERTQERIAAFDSSPQIKHWAAQKGWKLAEHGDFDDTTKVDQARAMAQVQATAQAQEQRGKDEEDAQ